MHVSTAVILTIASQSTLNPSIKPEWTEPNPSSPGLEAAVVAVMARMAVETVVVQDVGVVMVIKPTHMVSGKSNAKAVNAVTPSGGIRKHKGKWSMMCKSCGWNTTHTTGFHDSYVKDHALFSLPTTHLFWTKSGKSLSEKGRRASAPAVANPPVASATSLLIEWVH
jgi:hypothetical protein